MDRKSPKNRRLRKFFYLSLLCLFPAFGVIVGVILMYYAVFVFKNIKLVFTILVCVGGGILLLLADEAYLKHDSMYGEESGNMMAKVAAIELDSVARDLDDYRTEFGRYPDSLGQLVIVYPGLFINDPLATRMGQQPKSPTFHYKKEGARYVLFSVGVDGVPGTADDIYPPRPLEDSSMEKK